MTLRKIVENLTDEDLKECFEDSEKLVFVGYLDVDCSLIKLTRSIRKETGLMYDIDHIKVAVMREASIRYFRREK